MSVKISSILGRRIKMSKKFLLNIARGTIHDGDNPCEPAKRMKRANIKRFNNYQDAVNYYEGEDKKGIPCSICLKQYCR